MGMSNEEAYEKAVKLFGPKAVVTMEWDEYGRHCRVSSKSSEAHGYGETWERALELATRLLKELKNSSEKKGQISRAKKIF